MTSDVILQLEGIASAYGKIDAVKGINLEVKRGQIVTLLGANGAGKTTTLKTISGLVRAKAGRVLFEGNDITSMAAHQIARAGVVHVPEGRHVLRGLSVRENLELGAFTVQDPTLRKDRLEQVFAQFPILKTRGPKILLLDEPSMGLAPKLVLETMKIVKRLNQEGTTILLVEQNARLALRLAHYGYVLESGVIRLEGEAEKLRADPSIVQAYLGS